MTTTKRESRPAGILYRDVTLSQALTWLADHNGLLLHAEGRGWVAAALWPTRTAGDQKTHRLEAVAAAPENAILALQRMHDDMRCDFETRLQWCTSSATEFDAMMVHISVDREALDRRIVIADAIRMCMRAEDEP